MFAVELANYLANARALTAFRNVLADPKRHFNAGAYAKSRLAREASGSSVAPSTEQAAPKSTTSGPAGEQVPPVPETDSEPHKLPDEIRGDLEHATGRSLDHVRVHTGEEGDATAEAHGARAVTMGNDIYMRAGELDPVSPEGRELIAHEVAHTVQANTHPGSVATAAKRDAGATDAAEHEADAFAARFRAEGSAALWSPRIPVNGPTLMRAPAAGQSVDAARAREGFNAKLDNQLSIAARQNANISAPAYLHLHMGEVRRGVHLLLASRNLASGDPQVELRDGFFDALFAAFDGSDTAASVTRLRNWVAPSDLYAIVDRNRPIFEGEKAQQTHPSAALDYQHGPKGPAHWSPAVATAIGSAIEPRLISSLARMSPRLVAVTARKREAARESGEAPAPVQPKELVCEHPLDWHVALAMVGRATPGVEVKEGPLTVSPEAQVTYRKVTEVEWQGGRGGAWNALRPLAPHDANVAEIAVYIFGKSTEAYRIQRVGPFFVIPEEEASRILPAAMFRGIAGTGVNALAFGATAAEVENAEVERAVARDRERGNVQPAAASATALEAHWSRIQEQLQGIASVVRPYGLDGELSGALARHRAHKVDLQTLSGRDAETRAELFARQTVLLTKIAAEVGSVVSQAEEQRARTASIAAVMKAIGASQQATQDQSTTIALRRLVNAANLSHLPETGEAAFAEAHNASRDAISDTLEAMLGQAATQIEIARLTMSHSHGSSSRSTRVFGASFQQRADGLRQRLADLRSKLLHGKADPAEIQALFAAIDALRTETGMVAQIGQLGQLFDVLDQLESSGWVLFSEALTSKIGETTEDNRIGRLETARRGAFELRSDLQTLHSQWLKIQTSANALAEQLAAGGQANAQAQATAAVLPQLEAIRGKLAKLGGEPAVHTFLRDAYDKVDSAQTRAMIVQIASMIGIAVVSGGVAAMAEGVALGAGASVLGAQLTALGVETTTFTLLSARLSGESIVQAFASNFAGNLVTFGAIRATNALVAGSAIGRTLAQAKAGERVSRLAAIAAKTAEISAPMLVAIGVQFAQAEAEMLLREGRTLTLDELTATGVQGIAMMVGAAVTHKVLGESMNEAKAFGADFAARRAQRAHLEKLSQQVMAEGDGSLALDLMREARAYVEAEVAKWQELSKLPVNELEARGLSKPAVDAMGKNAQAHMAALDAMEAGTIPAQLGLDTVVPGHVYAGETEAVHRVLDNYRRRGYRVDVEMDGGYRVSRDDDPTTLRIVERQPLSHEATQAKPSADRGGVPIDVPLNRQELRKAVAALYPEIVEKYSHAPHTASNKYDALIQELEALKPGELGEASDPATKAANKERDKAILQRWMAISKELERETGRDESDLRELYNKVETVNFKEWQSALSHMPKEQQARMLHMYREELKAYIRDLMTDDRSKQVLYLRDRALYGNPSGPPFEALFAKQLEASGGDAERAYDAIISTSKQSNKAVNKGLTGNEAGIKAPRPPTEEEVRAWADALAESNPERMSPEEAKADLEAFRARRAQVKAMYDQVMRGEFEPPPGVTRERLRLAVEGDPATGERVPLTYASIDQFHQFQAELRAVLESEGITDATVVQLGSGTTGWSTAPGKTGKPWSPKSDVDFAIFSNQALAQAMAVDAPVNPKNKQNGRYTTLKNSPADRKGFYDTPLGKKLEALAQRWNEIVYGDPNAEGFDFKLNLGETPFESAVPIIVGKKRR